MMPESDLADALQDRSASELKSRRRVRYHQVMRLVRRTHLYAGLFMLPWVFLYGITALLFNHPGAFADQSGRRIERAAWSGTALSNLPEPERLATEVVNALNDSGGDRSGRPTYRLVRPEESAFGRELAATIRSGGRQYNLRIDIDSGEGLAREVGERRRPDPAPFATREAMISRPPPLADIREDLPKVLARVGLPDSELSLRGNPDLGFLMESGGKTWQVHYDLVTGAVSGRAEDQTGEPLSSRRFLTRLHLAHGYPAGLGYRWGWAVAVDLMFLSMVGWGITGLLMWWQMKNVRRVGAVVLVASILVASILAMGMHDHFASASITDRGNPPGSGTKPDAKALRTGPMNPPSNSLPRP
ncbi:hypothetical protein P12x_004332 [Tundrisphaera lichenicola]|uniref:hypothetical protein n=1 Tax=Tundrisphaera lichenicola TaxID=2029860 RepID=UPI003EB7D81E